MAGRPKSIDETRVFDVAKPGKAKPLGTSRPVIVNHADAVADSSVVNDKPVNPLNKSELRAPSEGRKIIQPLSTSSADEEHPSKAEETSGIKILREPKKAVKKSKSIKVVEEAQEEPERIIDLDKADKPTDDLLDGDPKEIDADELKDLEIAMNAEPAEEETEQPEERNNEPLLVSPDAKNEPETDEADQGILEKTSEEADDELTKKDEQTEVTVESEEEVTVDTTDEKPRVESPDNTDNEDGEGMDSVTPAGSEKAEVDALAEASQKNKATQKAADEQARIDKQLNSLIESKKYFVPLAHDSSPKRSHRKWGISFLLLILVVVGTYLAIDYKLVGASINLPFHFFPSKHEAATDSASTTSGAANDLITLPASGLKLLYDPKTWTTGGSTESSTGSTITLKAIDVSKYVYGAELKELVLATAAETDKLDYITSTKVSSNSTTDIYFYARVRSLTSQSRTNYLPECGLGSYPDNQITNTLGEIPVNKSTTVVNIACTFYEKDGTTPISSTSLAEAQSWFTSSSEYKKIKALLSSFKY